VGRVRAGTFKSADSPPTTGPALWRGSCAAVALPQTWPFPRCRPPCAGCRYTSLDIQAAAIDSVHLIQNLMVVANLIRDCDGGRWGGLRKVMLWPRDKNTVMQLLNRVSLYPCSLQTRYSYNDVLQASKHNANLARAEISSKSAGRHNSGGQAHPAADRQRGQAGAGGSGGQEETQPGAGRNAGQHPW